MILSMPDQALLFLSTVLVGMAIGVCFDVFRVLRRVATHKSWLVQVQDILFWLVATLGMFYFLLHRNFGEIRGFALGGAAIGAVLYFCTLSKLVLKVAVTVIRFLQKVIVAAFRIISAPIRFLVRLIAPPVKKFAANRRKSLRLAARYGKMRVKKSTRNLFLFKKKV